MSRLGWLEDVVRDLRYGLRVLKRSPVFTTVAILTLALGIGANAAIFHLIDTEPEVTPSQLAAKMNRFLHRSTASNSYATFFYAMLEADGRRLRYVNAGHNPPYLVRRTSVGIQVTELSVGGTVLGLFAETDYEDADVDLCPGDLLVAFTDGVTEARNLAGEEFGEERLKERLQRAVGMPAEQVSSMLAEQMRRWIAGAEQHDDVTFVVAAVSGSPAGVV